MKIEVLGTLATFLIPSLKVHNPRYSKSHRNVAKQIHRFLFDTFGGYTSSLGNVSGYFGPNAATNQVAEYDEHKEFHVAIRDDERGSKFRKLQKFLARLCADIDEKCIYLVHGGEAVLIYP